MHHHHHTGHSHVHHGSHHAVVAAPTFSLLRLSIGQRLAGAGVALAALWALVFLVLAGG